MGKVSDGVQYNFLKVTESIYSTNTISYGLLGFFCGESDSNGVSLLFVRDWTHTLPLSDVHCFIFYFIKARISFSGYNTSKLHHAFPTWTEIDSSKYLARALLGVLFSLLLISVVGVRNIIMWPLLVRLLLMGFWRSLEEPESLKEARLGTKGKKQSVTLKIVYGNWCFVGQ